MAVPHSSQEANRTLGRNISRLRKASGQSQEELAEQLSVTPRYLRKLESGMHAPSLPVLQKAKRALKVEWGELLKGL